MSIEVVIVQHAEKRPEPGDPGLTSTGRRQADRVAGHLAATISPAALYSSPLRRAVETAAAIADRLQVTVQVDARLRERMNWGASQTQAAFLVEWQRATADRDFAPTVGDSARRAGARFIDALDDLARRHGTGTVLVVAHGGVTVDLLRILMGDVAVRRVAPTVITHGVPSCALTHLVEGAGTWDVLAIASTDHLDV